MTPPMIISRLQIHGFKSFADKVTLDFQKGITAVVGPNGCGKSNIVDAVRWVMGEQSAKTLRGKCMEDTIFGGSERRKPLGMAEVSLFFSTEDGRVPAKYLNFSEIQVTRRLFRDGESEYLLNGTQCRLLDIAELFMDTGAGAKAYSIIEQGKIGMILSSRPEERRLIIEEAAGVTKFKARKQVAMKKIEATRQNLLRIGDIVAEIRRQMNSLQRQARKAEQFREYREELKEIELLFAVRGYMGLAAEKQSVQTEVVRLRDGAAANSLEIQGCSLALEKRRAVLLEKEKELTGAQEQNYRLRSEISACESRLAFQRKELAGHAERMSAFAREVTVVLERIKESEDELRRLREEGETLTGTLAGEEKELAASEEALEGLIGEEKALAGRLEERRRELFTILSEISQFNNQHAAAARRLEAVKEQTERNRREGIGLQEKLSLSDGRVSELEAAHAALAERKVELEGKAAKLRQLEADLRGRLETVEHSFHAERDRLSKKASRLHSLQELEAQFAGYGRGVRTLCLAEPFKGRLEGVVADILEVPEECEVALEAALAERLQYVICDGEADAREAVSFLQANKGGRCGLIRKDLRSAAKPETPAGAECLLDRVTVQQDSLGIAEVLLAGTFLVDDLDTALRLGGEHPGLTFVTRAGDVVCDGGILHGGSTDIAQHGLIHKKRQIKELALEVEALTARVGDLESERERLRSESRNADEALKNIRQELHRTELMLVNIGKDLLSAREELQRIKDRLAVKALEDEQLKEELEALEKELAFAARERRSREAGKSAMEQELNHLHGSLGGKQNEIAALREKVTALKVRCAALREKRESGRVAMLRVEEGITELRSRGVSLEKEIEQAARSREEIAAALAAGEDDLQSLLERQGRLEAACVGLRAEYEAESEAVGGQEHALKGLRSSAEELARELGERSLKLAEIEMRLQNLEETVAERYRFPISDVVSRYGHLDFDEQEKRSRQAELTRLIEGIGEVNLTAIEEFRSLEARFEFLSEQKADLEESLHGLQQAIQRINRTTRKRFLDTFNQVNEKFREVFPRLFCGGRAELRLTNEDDLLETGIDIIIQPPGKKLQNVNLLSGGEKALTAVALMFSIFLIKPAPFCLLDEVDAPLDEANIGRFNEMVREMSAFSQFIIITHNKATMTNADCLYGVTMEEPGVSKLVSVKLQ